MADWIRIASYVLTATAATAVAVTALIAEYRRREALQHENETLTRRSGYNGNNGSRARGNQNHIDSQNSNSRARELSQERRRRLIELRENRIREIEEERERQREEEERKRKREEEERREREEERKKEMELLNNFDDAFDAETGVTTERGYVERNFDDLGRHLQNQRSKREYRSKQLAKHQKSQDQER